MHEGGFSKMYAWGLGFIFCTTELNGMFWECLFSFAHLKGHTNFIHQVETKEKPLLITFISQECKDYTSWNHMFTKGVWVVTDGTIIYL